MPRFGAGVLTAGTLDCTGALDGWTITSPTARACAPDDDLLLRRGDVITLDGEVYRPAGYRPSTYDERLVSASVERPVWVRIGRMAGRALVSGVVVAEGEFTFAIGDTSGEDGR